MVESLIYNGIGIKQCMYTSNGVMLTQKFAHSMDSSV